jgi:flagellar basal body-associated protein FliL
MQPQQPYYPPPNTPTPQGGAGQFDFIVNNSTPSRGPNKKTLLIFGLGAALLIIVLAWVILALAFSGNGSATAPLVSIAQQQNEIARVAKSANTPGNLTTQDARNFSRNTELTIETDQSKLIDLLKKNGTKLNNKLLAAKQSATTDEALSAAAASGTYDSTLTSTLQTQLNSYQASLNNAYGSATSASEKKLLKAEYNNATLLIEQSTQHN